MNRTELTLVIAGTILLAVLVGWILRWLYSRFKRAGTGTAGSNELAHQLQEAEKARDQAYEDRDSAISDLRNKLGQTEAELRAAMDGLGDARREAEALRAELTDKAS